MGSCRAKKKVSDPLYDAIDLGFAVKMVERQTQGFGREALGNRERAGALPEIVVSRLQVDRFGIMNVGADAGRVKLSPQRVAAPVADADGKDMPHRLRPGL